MIIDFKDAYQFLEENNYGISAISKPIDHTIVYISLKIQDKINALEGHKNIFVFAQQGICPNKEIETANVFCFVEDPNQEFNKYLERIVGNREKNNRLRKYYHTSEGYICGENVAIGKNTYIEPGVFIDHDVSIGCDCTIKYGAVLRNCIVGNNCNIGEEALIGNEPYNYHDNEGVKVKSIAVGGTVLKDFVDVGAHSIVDRGTLSDTIICQDVKIDTYVHVGHDAFVNNGATITSTSIIGGFCEVGSNSKICSATLMKRIRIGENAFVGLNSGVIANVADGSEVFGYPARLIKKAKL